MGTKSKRASRRGRGKVGSGFIGNALTGLANKGVDMAMNSKAGKALSGLANRLQKNQDSQSPSATFTKGEPGPADAAGPAAGDAAAGTEKGGMKKGDVDSVGPSPGNTGTAHDIITLKTLKNEQGANYRQAVLNFIKKVITKIKDFLKRIFDILFVKSPIAKYIALIVVILFIIIFFPIYFSKKKKKNKSSSRTAATKDTRNQSMLETVKQSGKSAGASMSSLGSTFGSRSNNGTPREEEQEGRCNDVEWVSTEGQLNGNNVGLCFQSAIDRPAPIRWIIDPTNMYEYDTYPSAFKEKLKSEPGKLMITIPYVSKGASYVLSCMDAVYEDGTSAKELFAEETDTYCRLNTKNLNQYTPKQRAPKGSSTYQGLDTYLG